MAAKKTDLVSEKIIGGTNLTDWIYRGGSFMALLGVVTWLGVNLMSGQTILAKNFNDMHGEFQQKLSDMRNDFQIQFASTNNGVTVLTGQVGQNTGNMQMMTSRLENQGKRINDMDQRLTRLEALQGAK